MYANAPGHIQASAISMMRSVVGAAAKADEQTLNAVLDKLKALPTWGRGVDYVTNQLWWSGKGAQLIEIAEQTTPGYGISADNLQVVFYRALDKSFAVKDADPMRIWDHGLERVGFFNANWIPATDRPVDDPVWSFLGRLLSERPQQFWDYAKAVDNRWSGLMPILHRLDTKRLLRLYNSLPKGNAQEDVLSVLAFKYRSGMAPEIATAVWQLPDDDLEASFRITDIKIGEVISGQMATN
jgi:hypothetical protein